MFKSTPRLLELVGLWAIESAHFSAMLMDSQGSAPAAVKPTRTPMEMHAGKGGSNVAVIKAQGVLTKGGSMWMGGTSTIQLRNDIRAASNDPTVSGILLGIDSPGGSVAGTADLGADIKAARRKKPVWAHIDDLGASAAYWMASQADAIYANSATAEIGSIGTIMTVYDFSQMVENAGIKAHVFATGPLKGAGVMGAQLSDEQQSYFQTRVNDAQTHFDAAVRAGRGLSAAQLAAVKTGGVFSATEAQDKRLIDGIRSFESTLAALAAAK